MPDPSDSSLLDLSAWPARPPQKAPTASLPSRPQPRRRRPLGPLVALVGVLALLLPIPGSGCAGALVSWSSPWTALPSHRPPALDDAALAVDDGAVADARAALVAQLAKVEQARALLRGTPEPPTTSATPDPVVAAAVADDRTALDAARAELDRLVEEQQAAADPASYDASVAAAQERVDVAQAQLAEDQRARAQPPARPVVTGPVPGRAEAQAVVDQAPDVRKSLEAKVTQVQRNRADHLADRREQLATWAKKYETERTRAVAANAHRARCRHVTAAPAAGGATATAAAGALVGRAAIRRRRASLGRSYTSP